MLGWKRTFEGVDSYSTCKYCSHNCVVTNAKCFWLFQIAIKLANYDLVKFLVFLRKSWFLNHLEKFLEVTSAFNFYIRYAPRLPNSRFLHVSMLSRNDVIKSIKVVELIRFYLEFRRSDKSFIAPTAIDEKSERNNKHHSNFWNFKKVTENWMKERKKMMAHEKLLQYLEISLANKKVGFQLTKLLQFSLYNKEWKNLLRIICKREHTKIYS